MSLVRGYPRVDEYLGSLPGGLQAFPTYEAKASLVRFMVEVCPAPRDPVGLPPAIASLLLDPPPANVWIPEVHHLAAALALADHHGLDGRGLQTFFFEQSSALAQSPLYRQLLSMLSPSTILKTAHLRWTGFHRGLELEASATGDVSLELVLRHPPGLLTPLLAEAFVGVFAALASLSTEPGSELTLAALQPSRTTYRLAWGASAANTG